MGGFGRYHWTSDRRRWRDCDEKSIAFDGAVGHGLKVVFDVVGRKDIVDRLCSDEGFAVKVL